MTGYNYKKKTSGDDISTFRNTKTRSGSHYLTYENHLTNIAAGPVTLYDDSFHTIYISISKPTKHFSLTPLFCPSRWDHKQPQLLPMFTQLINRKIHLLLQLNDIILFQINQIRVTQLHRLAGTFLIHEVLPDMEVIEESSGSALKGNEE